MKETPILFSTDMVKAIIEGRKTQTRRICKPQPGVHAGFCRYDILGSALFSDNSFTRTRWTKRDTLWVRETFLSGFEMEDEKFKIDAAGRYIPKVWYRATDGDLRWYDGESDWPRENAPWKPSIHMPKSAARIWLEVTNVRVERLHDISEDDAIAEGIEQMRIGKNLSYRSYVTEGGGRGVFPYVSFCTLWQLINGRESWEANPWVWVIGFKVLSTTGRP